VGASLFTKADVHYYFDITRWEIQLRFRKGMGNWMFDNPEAPILTKYKVGFFIEWRLADAHKEENFGAIDYWVDANRSDRLTGINQEMFYTAFRKILKEPFRMEPYFDKSVWGGQWMKHHFGLEEDVENFGWAFDGVPEENSVRFSFGEVSVTFPTMNLVKLFPKELLGERVYHTFGAEFPIRFDLLDTFEGGNLSLQVHPTLDYIKSAFGMSYTQDESYYILDATENSCVYLGLKEGIDQEVMIADLEAANRGEIIFDTEKYVNKIPVKKHDHILIPAGTVHCSGKDTLVLEISATPYIFTFKLWDWGSIGLDGLPRPVHINHGRKNIQWDRDTHWVSEHLIHQEKVLHKDENSQVERTGLHAYEFIETLRYTFRDRVEITLKDSVAVLNLIEGKEAWIKSGDDRWRPKKIHYGETFIVPAGVERLMLESCGDNEVRVILAMVR
jgi:mannose-6-phosphate isomerase class I